MDCANGILIWMRRWAHIGSHVDVQHELIHCQDAHADAA